MEHYQVDTISDSIPQETIKYTIHHLKKLSFEINDAKGEFFK